MSARASALRVLTACRSAGAWADAALSAELRRANLSAADAGLASRIVYGVVQNRMLLDHCLGAYCRQRLDHLQQPLPDILRMGAYQILFLDKVPNSAAVNEAVELAKASGRGSAAGLVNAVLRKLSAAPVPPLPEGDEARRLSITYSHPMWLTERMIALLGQEEAERFFRANNSLAPLTVQINPLKTTREALMAQLVGEGIDVRPHPWVPDCLELRGVGDLTTLGAFYRGEFTVQDGAARLVTLAAGIAPGMRVLDLCAAPGGKSFSAAFAMGGRGSITACDIHENKLKRLREGAKRLGIDCIETIAQDGRAPRPEWYARFDAALCDVPCSGLGIIRKKPDVRYKDPAALRGLPAVQRSILEGAARCVRPGGVLAYSTCTVLPEENGSVVHGFLKDHPEFAPEPFAFGAETAEGEATLWPQRHDTDGFYIAIMRRST